MRKHISVTAITGSRREFCTGRKIQNYCYIQIFYPQIPPSLSFTNFFWQHTVPPTVTIPFDVWIITIYYVIKIKIIKLRAINVRQKVPYFRDRFIINLPIPPVFEVIIKLRYISLDDVTKYLDLL